MGSPGGDIHVTSKAIRKCGKSLSTEVKPLAIGAKNDVDKTEVGFPGFGLIGLGIQAGYHEIQTYARNYLQAAADCLERFHTQLNDVATNWEKAKDSSTVKTQ